MQKTSTTAPKWLQNRSRNPPENEAKNDTKKHWFYKPVLAKEREARFISQTSRTSPSLWLCRFARCEAANVLKHRSLRSLACARELRSPKDLRLATAFPQGSFGFARICRDSLDSLGFSRIPESLRKFNQKPSQNSFKILPKSYQIHLKTFQNPPQIHPEPPQTLLLKFIRKPSQISLKIFPKSSHNLPKSSQNPPRIRPECSPNPPSEGSWEGIPFWLPF